MAALSRVVVVAVAALAVSVAPTASGGGAAGSRVVDRTLLCPVPVGDDMLRHIGFYGQSGVRDRVDRSRWFALAEASLLTGDGLLANVLAGSPRAKPRAQQLASTFWAFTAKCTPSATGVRLSPRNLFGGRASQFPDRYECPAPRRVLVRVRAEFKRAVTVAHRQGGLITSAPLVRGAIAVATEDRKPLIYMDVEQTGRSRLFYTGSCTRP